MRPVRTTLLFAMLAIPALAASYSLELKPEATKVEWTLADTLHIVHGTFNVKSGKIEFDPEKGTASGEVTVDVASGASGSGARDHRMHANILESGKFPEAIFTPDRMEGKLAVPGSSTVRLHGMLKIHGSAHELWMNVEAKATESQIESVITFEIPYVAWGIKDPSNFLFKVNKSVQCSIRTVSPLVKR